MAGPVLRRACSTRCAMNSRRQRLTRCVSMSRPSMGDLERGSSGRFAGVNLVQTAFQIGRPGALLGLREIRAVGFCRSGVEEAPRTVPKSYNRGYRHGHNVIESQRDGPHIGPCGMTTVPRRAHAAPCGTCIHLARSARGSPTAIWCLGSAPPPCARCAPTKVMTHDDHKIPTGQPPWRRPSALHFGACPRCLLEWLDRSVLLRGGHRLHQG